jgi:hypothetical protein
MELHYWTFQFGRAAVIFTQYEAATMFGVVFVLCLIAFALGRIRRKARHRLPEKSLTALHELQRNELEQKIFRLSKTIAEQKAEAFQAEHKATELVKASREVGMEEGRITTTNEIRQTIAAFFRAQADFLEGESVQVVENTHTLNREENFPD